MNLKKIKVPSIKTMVYKRRVMQGKIILRCAMIMQSYPRIITVLYKEASMLSFNSLTQD